MKNEIFADMLSQPHLLIAGTTGSGKSVLINGLMCEALEKPSNEVQFILIDPKRVELIDYKDLPHTVRYADQPETMIDALNYALNLCELRFKIMQEQRLKKSNAADLYVIIDEFADLMLTNHKVRPIIQRISQIGRAAKVHSIIATQTPIVEVIPTAIKVNYDARVGLRTRSAQDSRNILGHNGCEDLPRYGKAIYMTPEGEREITIPMTTQGDVAEATFYWSFSHMLNNFCKRVK